MESAATRPPLQPTSPEPQGLSLLHCSTPATALPTLLIAGHHLWQVGNAVYISSYDYLRADRFGFCLGVDDLFWRSSGLGGIVSPL